ncbi:MAG: hypothetical protein ING66_17045 [Rhodocyclaceae bacterium]|jgi:hypothetical protein|nr:hypothetical protein [Rhodocyclaceae bacterium]MCE2724664.1 hypothetical protein [Betaproteobacteria bacterium]MCA3017996.1 hypothetical protein [Rhodocyclaceae bacterium]MCA3021568.1 hypothetical protein [Rhodocyclaceae bacterium]MCA3026613.1 hypothetical protein [Rhodocyclaceae bacterium]
MKKGAKQQIQVVIPDAGPLISLARAAALEILLVFKDDVRIVITDYVEFETTRFKDRFPDAQRICNFISANAGRVEIQETLFGKTMKQMYLMRQRFEQDAQFRASMLAINAEPPAVSRDAGELSIVSYAAELIKRPPGTPVLVLAEDDFFLNSGAATPGNTHILSTRAFLETLQTMGKIPDARRVWEEIQVANPTVNPNATDRQAGKIKTDWIGAVDDEKAKRFRPRGST